MVFYDIRIISASVPVSTEADFQLHAWKEDWKMRVKKVNERVKLLSEM